MRLFFCLLLLTISSLAVSQRSAHRIRLDRALSEISGLERYNDSTLIAINDSGNLPIIYFISLKGEIMKRTIVSNATNTDWEDLTTDDKGNLYIADAGNNFCNRNDLCVWKVDLQGAFTQDSVVAERIWFQYSDQKLVIPAKKECRYDSEAIFWYNDSLNILTKNTTKPRKNYWDNGSSVYRIPDHSGNFNAVYSRHLWTGGDNRIRHQVTGAVVLGQQLAVLTYGKIFFYPLEDDNRLCIDPLVFKMLKQREAVVVLNENTIIIGAERHPLLGGPYLYTLEWK